MEALMQWMVDCVDLVLGWLLRAPSDVILIAVALGTSLLMVGIRKYTTNQDLLRRVADDLARLKELTREAKAAANAEALARYKNTQQMLQLFKLQAEGKPLLYSLLPIAFLATWALARLEFHPPAANQPVRITFNTPASAANADVVHLVPLAGVTAENGWVREVELLHQGGVAAGEAVFQLNFAPRPEPYKLQFRFRGKAYEHDILVGRPTYLPIMADHGNQIVTVTELKNVQLFGFVPGVQMLAFPPWLVAYILLVIPAVPLLKMALRIY